MARVLRLFVLLGATLLFACEEDRAGVPHDPRTDAAVIADAGAKDAAISIDAGLKDAGEPADAASTPDAEFVDSGELADAAAPDATEPPDSGAPTDAGFPDVGFPDSGAWCGNGALDPGELCDDGTITSGCDVTHDGGDGACLPLGQCAQGYLLDGNGACIPTQLDARVIIDVDNFCNMAVTPQEVVVPAGQTIYVDWYNRSRDYPVDVWLSYGGGYLDLETGNTWDEPISHCSGPNPHNEYADVSTACSNFRFYFRCL